MSFCSVVNPLAEAEVAAVTQINKKMLALQHLSALLEVAGDASAAFIGQLGGVVGNLVPVTDINTEVYVQLVSACPFINLPPVTAGGEVGVAALQALVLRAYDSLVRRLLKHPYARMAALQAELDAFVASVGVAEAVVTGAFQCLQAACSGQLFTAQSSASASAQFGQYQAGFVASGGKVLNGSAQGKAAQVQLLVGKMQNLGATAGVPYALAKFKQTVTQSTAAGVFIKDINYQFLDQNSNSVIVTGQSVHDRGEWNATTVYNKFDVVSFNGVLYIALDSTSTPPTNG